MLAPIIIFVYNRLEHAKETIEALSHNYLANETDVYIFSDASKDEKSLNEVENVRRYIDSLFEKNIFKSVKTVKSESHKGLANSVISGVSQVINKHGKVIVVEDDLISSRDFLQYMNDALNYYESDGRIWSISGYNLPIEVPKDYKSEIYLSYRGCSWGYATWKNRWERVDWDVSDYDCFKSNRKLRNKFNRGGRDMSNMLDAQMLGKIDSWAIRWCYSQSKLDMLTVYPVASRIKNIGMDGTGEHCDINNKYDSSLNCEFKKVKFDNLGLDRRIVRLFKDKYGTRYEYFIILLKSFIKKILSMR